MKAEARKSFRHGFNLTEQELLRIVDTAKQQVRRVSENGEACFEMEATLKNGAVVEAPSVDELLSWENAGSRRVVGLAMGFMDRREKPQYVIHLHFADPGEEDEYLFGPVPIRYLVRGEDRDWVLVTSSELEERVSRVKSFAWPQFFLGKRGAVSVSGIMSIVFLLFMVLSIHFASGSNRIADTMESRWKAGTLRDPVEAVVLMERAYELREVAVPGALVKAAIYAVGAMAALVLIVVAAYYLYPAYVFCWGDAATAYQTRLSTRRWPFGVVVTGLLLSVLGSVIVERLRWLK